MGHISNDGRLCVKAVSIDKLFRAGELPEPDFVKIDVEGAELLVLSGAKTTLTTAHPTIFLATHGDDIHKSCCDFLHELGYRLQNIGAQDEILAQYPE